MILKSKRLTPAAPERLAGPQAWSCLGAPLWLLHRNDAGRLCYLCAPAVTRMGWSWRLAMRFHAPLHLLGISSYTCIWQQALGRGGRSSNPAKLTGNPMSFSIRSWGYAAACKQRSPPLGAMQSAQLKLMVPSRRMTNPKQNTGWANNSYIYLYQNIYLCQFRNFCSHLGTVTVLFIAAVR